MANVATARPKSPQRSAPRNISVYRALDGAVHHTRCHRRMTYLGHNSGGLELQFHCTACHERVVFPEIVVAGLPVG
jgi:hypothetical protein